MNAEIKLGENRSRWDVRTSNPGGAASGVWWVRLPLSLANFKTAGLAVALLLAGLPLARAEGEADRGARKFSNLCTPCHSLKAGRQMTGPSLAGIVGKKAGSVEGFARYSKALPQSPVEWNEQTLDAWLANPQALVPGNLMTFAVDDAPVRADIVAYLAATQKAGGGNRDDLPKAFESILDLKSAGAATTVAAIAYCGDTYTLKMGNGATIQFWERNLRLKTDSSPEGPTPGKPVLVPSGQQGDRSYLVFARPQEINDLIKPGC